ncbi:MAG TPA: rhombosortase [Steroidobacteraceae bacterium]|nr:rhombosortase [Steroidobacteraceae bacterium]
MTDKRAGRGFPSLNCDGHYALCLLALLAALWLIELLVGPQRAAWYYDRPALLHGEAWRLLSAHFVHLGPLHTLLNSAGLVLLWVLYARTLPLWQWLLVSLGSMAAIDAGLWWLDPQVEWYAGASGWLHGVLAAGAVLTLWRERSWSASLMVGVLALKLTVEQLRGDSVVAEGLPVLVQAHLYGAVGGLFTALCLARTRQRL